MEKVRSCAVFGKILICVDGLISYIKATRKAFREQVRTGHRGRPKFEIWQGLCIGQVVKQYAKKRVVAVKQRIVEGTRQRVSTLIKRSQGCGSINTSFIERINGVFSIIHGTFYPSLA
jgi:uncharacterized phage protein gp47/JayE